MNVICENLLFPVLVLPRGLCHVGLVPPWLSEATVAAAGVDGRQGGSLRSGLDTGAEWAAFLHCMWFLSSLCRLLLRSSVCILALIVFVCWSFIPSAAALLQCTGNGALFPFLYLCFLVASVPVYLCLVPSVL